MNNTPASSECTSAECKGRRTAAEEETARVRQEWSRTQERVRELERNLAAAAASSNKGLSQPPKPAGAKGQQRRRKAAGGGGGESGARCASDESAERERERQTQRASPAHSEATSSGGSTTDNAAPQDSRSQRSSLPVPDESKELRQRLEFMQRQHNAEKSRVYELISALTEKNAAIERLHRMQLDL